MSIDVRSSQNIEALPFESLSCNLPSGNTIEDLGRTRLEIFGLFLQRFCCRPVQTDIRAGGKSLPQKADLAILRAEHQMIMKAQEG